MKDKPPKKTVFLHKWNKDRHKRDGKLFHRIEAYLPQNRANYIRLYCYYYIQNPNFFVTEILDDNFRLYRKNEYELKNIEQTIKNDFMSMLARCHRPMTLKKMILGDEDKTELPYMFYLYHQNKISIHTIIAMLLAKPKLLPEFNERKLNMVDEEKLKQFNKIFDKYLNVVYNFFEDVNWNNFFKEILEDG